MAQHTPTSYDVLIAHADADRAWVEGYLLDALAHADTRCHAVSALDGAGAAALERSRHVVLVLSSAGASDLNAWYERFAHSFGATVAKWPVTLLRLSSVDVPSTFDDLPTLDATTRDRWPAAVEALCKRVGRTAPGPSSAPFCPYLGLRPFAEADSKRFHGRTREVKALVEQLHRRSIAMLIGPSGVGKTSLLQAGLVPALRRTSAFGSGSWLVRTVRPGSNPLQTLLAALGQERAARSPEDVVEALLAQAAGAERLLLVVDNVEELFIHATTGRSAFQKALVRLANVPNCYLVLALDAHFYDAVLSAPLWSAVHRHVIHVLPMKDSNLRTAIVQPAAAVDVHVDPALVDRLVADATGIPDGLCALQETLVLLWNSLERRYLPVEAYDALVRRSAGTPSLDGDGTADLRAALAHAADTTLEALPERNKTIARHLFLELVRVAGTASPVTRRRPLSALRADIEASVQFKQTLHQLVKGRLLTVTENEYGGEPTVEITHDALRRYWPTLQDWVSEWYTAEQTRSRLEAWAARWSQAPDDDALLLDEADVREAERWLAGPVAAEIGYSDRIPALIEASRSAIEAAQKEQADADRRELDATKARIDKLDQQLDTERERTADLQRETRIFRLLSLGLGLFFLLALGAGIVAGYGQQRARTVAATAQADADTRATVVVGLQATLEAGNAEQRAGADRRTRLERANHLAAEAVVQGRAGDTDLALLLAREGIRTTYAADDAVTYTVDRAVRDALYAAGWRPPQVAHEAAANNVAFSADTRLLLTASDDGTARLWSLPRGTERTVLRGHDGPVADATFSPDGRLIATGGHDGTTRIWDIAGTQRFTLTAHTGPVRAVRFSPDGTRLVTASDDGTVRLWDPNSGEQLRTFAESNVGLASVAFTPDGARIVTGGTDGTARIWDASTGEQLVVFVGHSDTVDAVAVDPRGWLVATADGGSCEGSCLVYLWKLDDGTVQGAYTVHRSAITGIAFSADSTWLTTASTDGTVGAWSVDSGEPRARITDSTGALHDVAVSPDGSWLAAAGADGIVRRWPLAPQLLMELATQHVRRTPPEFTCEERVRFLDATDACASAESQPSS